MSMRVNIAVVQEGDDWFVDVSVDGEHYDRLKAGSREEARAMHADIVKLAQQSGGTLMWLNDWYARRN